MILDLYVGAKKVELKKLPEYEGRILPDNDSLFWDWFNAMVENQRLIHEISINLTGETAWDRLRRSNSDVK